METFKKSAEPVSVWKPQIVCYSKRADMETFVKDEQSAAHPAASALSHSLSATTVDQDCCQYRAAFKLKMCCVNVA